MIFRLGVALMLASSIPWLLLLVVPVLPWSLATRGMVAGVLLASAEVTFWLGVAAAGRETWRAAKRAGWRRLPGELWRMFIRGRAEPAAAVAEGTDQGRGAGVVDAERPKARTTHAPPPPRVTTPSASRSP